MNYICDNCGKTFKRAPSNIRGKKKFCSFECAHSGSNNPRFRSDITEKSLLSMYPQMTMQQIADHYNVILNTIWKRMKKYGIVRNRTKKGNNNPHWKGGLVTLKCQFCGKPFQTFIGQVKTRKFCSYQCSAAYERRNGVFATVPNRTEKSFIDLCKVHNLPFKFVGDGKFFVGTLNPDFIHINDEKIALEIFGDYWHTKKVRKYHETEDGRKAYFKNYGVFLIVIWEHELQQPEKVLEKLLCVRR